MSIPPRPGDRRRLTFASLTLAALAVVGTGATAAFAAGSPERAPLGTVVTAPTDPGPESTATATPTEPTPTEPTPTESAPTESAPVEPTPTDPTPVPTGPTSDPTEPPGGEETCEVPEPTPAPPTTTAPSTAPTTTAPETMAPATAATGRVATVGYRVNALQQRKCKTIQVSWVPLTSLFKTKEVPILGDTLEFEADISIPGKMKDLAGELATGAAGGKKIVKVTIRCKVTALDNGADAITVECQLTDMTVEVKGAPPIPVKFPATTPKILAGISIVK